MLAPCSRTKSRAMPPLVNGVYKVRRIVLALLFGMTFAPTATAHNEFEIDLTGGYRFGSKIKAVTEDDQGNVVSDGDYRIDGAFAFSAIAGYRIQPDGFIYLSYSRQQTTSEYEGNGGVNISGKTAVEYYQFGGNVEMTRGRFVPYLGFSVGLARLAALGGGGSSRVFFAPVFDSGFKIDLHKNVHLRFLGRLPVFFASGDVFCPSGGTCVEASQIRLMAQPELHAGVGVSF